MFKTNLYLLIIVGIFALLFTTSSQATLYYLESGNSEITIDPETHISPPSNNGLYSWIVDGIENIYQEWFFYRINNYEEPEEPINSLPLKSVTQNSPDQIKIVYEKSTQDGIDFTFVLTIKLYGGATGSNKSRIREEFTVINGNISPKDFSIFEYDDFDLNGPDYDVISGDAKQFHQKDVPSGFYANVVTRNRPADKYKGDYYSSIPNILDILTDSNIDDLDNINHVSDPGDVAWAYQWDISLDRGKSFTIYKDKYINTPVPEPSTLIMIGSGLIGLFSYGSLRLKKRNRAIG